MMQKNATPNKDQQKILKAQGMNPLLWAVQKERDHYLIIKNRMTGEFKEVGKEKSV